jgi:hypothetical protein
MKRPASPKTMLLVLLAAVLCVAACSSVRIAYRSADFLLARYADDYLGLSSNQIEAWEPRLKVALAEHRAQELPQLAGFFDQALQASRAGFGARDSQCLATAFKDLYRDHARLAAGLAAPLLAGLDPQQVAALGQRFQVEYEDDRIKPGTSPTQERRKRTRRYIESVEDWTGHLNRSQRELVSGIAGRMPDTRESVLAYRTKKREALMALLRAGAGEARIGAFLTDWLVDYRDLPPDLVSAGAQIETRVAELLTRLWVNLDATQRERVQTRLAGLRDDLLALQKRPRLAPLRC